MSKKNKQIYLNSALRYRKIDTEGVLVHLEQGKVIVVNEVGLFIIQQLEKPQTSSELIQAITESFNVSAQQAADDLDNFLNELAGEHLVHRQNHSSTDV